MEKFLWKLVSVLIILSSVNSLPINYRLSKYEKEQYDIENEEADTTDEVEPELKIVGGKDAERGNHPHIISLQYNYPGMNRMFHTCGGAIVSPEFIVTAAHCIHPTEMQQYEVAAGLYNLKENEDSEQRRHIWRAYVHPEFKGGISQGDIALIQLELPLIFTSTVNKVGIANETSEPFGGKATLFGWGSTSRTNKPHMPNILQEMEAPIISNKKCRDVLHAGSMITNKNICTGPISGQPSACSGDSGSALTKGDVMIGVVSWGTLIFNVCHLCFFTYTKLQKLYKY